MNQLENREVPATLGISDATLSEGHSGFKTATLTVTLSSRETRSVSVQYATGDGTARAGQDYNATSRTLTFSPGQTTKTIGIGVLGDTLAERDETFAVSLSRPTNATIGRGVGRVTVTNDDPRSFVFFFAGFSLSSAGGSGLEALRQRMLSDQATSRNAVFSQVDYYDSDVTAAREAVRQTLDAQSAASIDRVVLVGHSYGGNMAYALAGNVDGRGRAATAIATLDPIDWNAPFSQGYEKPLPQGLAASNVLNLVQRTGSLQGFVIAPLTGVVNDNVTAGPDGRLGTGDDLQHTTLDDSAWVQDRVRGFVRQFVWG